MTRGNPNLALAFVLINKFIGGKMGKFASLCAKIIGICMGIMLLTACNSNDVGGSPNAAPMSIGDKIQLQNESDDTAGINVQYSIDGFPEVGAGNSAQVTIHDLTKHLLTLSVIRQATPNPPVNINGLQWDFSVKPSDKRGESLVIDDINCKTAVFSKNGDSCSVYVQLVYDRSTGTTPPPTFHVRVGAKSNGISTILSIDDNPTLTIGSADYRVISPLELAYYAGSAVAANPGQYQMLSMKNLATPLLTIDTITALTNPAFSLMNRENADSDPYYGTYAQCALTADTDKKQVNTLDTEGSECILVYKAASTSDKPTENDGVSLKTTEAKTTFPWILDKNMLHLVANYAQGVPIPEQAEAGGNFQIQSGSAHAAGGDMVMDTDGVVSSGLINPTNNLFSLVNVSYDFSTTGDNNNFLAPYGIPFYQNGVLNVANQSIPVGTAMILTDASATNPVTVGGVTQLVATTLPASGSSSVDACNGAHADSNAQITVTEDQANRGVVELHMYNHSNGSCGGDNVGTIDQEIPSSGYAGGVVYNDDQTGCGGGTWDIQGLVSVSGSGCAGDNCNYTVHVHAHHGGDAWCDNDGSYDLNFTRPQVYMQLSGLGNFTPAASTNGVLAVGGQNLNATLGGSSGVVAQNIVYTGKPAAAWHAAGLYSNGLSSNTMLYNIGLNAGNTLHQGTLDFTRTDGYDFTDFDITH
jgi:hypothetical protein